MHDRALSPASPGSLRDVYARLLAARGHQRWWPGETPFEVAVGAVLTQNTAWTNVERAIANLKAAGALDASALVALDEASLAALLRPAGYFNVKARRLRALVRYLLDEAGGDPARLDGRDLPRLRASLLAVPGVGRETADSILLYAVGLPVFVVDAYTRRIFGRLGRIDPDADYDAIRAVFEAALPRDVGLYNDYHAQIVAHGKDACRPRPRCEACVLADVCARSGGGVGEACA
jgi:endonuclease-3 related protein